MTTKMPAATDAQRSSWYALMDLHSVKPTGWTLVGGQMVHLICAERGASPTRPTDDADTVLDVRAEPHVLLDVTRRLYDLGFEPAGTSPQGHQHRWRRGAAVVDILIPRHLGARAENRKGAGGGTTIATPGAQQALDRTHDVSIEVDGRTGMIRRPDMLGALVAKAAALEVPLDTARGRHLYDFALLASLVTPRDELWRATSRDRRRLGHAMGSIARDPRQVAGVPDAHRGLERLRTALAASPSQVQVGTQARLNAGRPEGGQFAPRRRGEAGVSL